MFFNDACKIIINICPDNQTVLGLSVHSLSINIILLLFVLHKPTFRLEFLEMFNCAFINARIIFACAFRKVDFGLNYMIKGHFIITSLCACFIRVKHIVRSAFHFFDKMFWRSNTTKGFNYSHNKFKIKKKRALKPTDSRTHIY